MNEYTEPEQGITEYASLLNAAHLLAEEMAVRLRELAERYPDALPQDVVEQMLPHRPMQPEVG